VFIPSYIDGESLHDITTNFQLVNNFGAIIFFLLLCGYLQFAVTQELKSCHGVLFALWIVALWAPHFLAMQIFRFRHAGKVCSGDFYQGRWELAR